MATKTPPQAEIPAPIEEVEPPETPARDPYDVDFGIGFDFDYTVRPRGWSL